MRELIGLARCAHRVHLDRHGDRERRAQTSAFLELLWDDLALPEHALAHQFDATRVDRDAPSDIRRQLTLGLMREGAMLIDGGRLDIGDLAGDIPLLKRIDQRSALGRHAYIPAIIRPTAIEPESGSGERHALALCGFAELLDHTQGWRPAKAVVVGKDGSEQDLDLDAYRPRYQELRRRMRRVLTGIEQTAPGSKAECRMCAWRVHCHDELVRADDLTLVPGIGEVERARLREAGVFARGQLASATLEALDSGGVGKRRAASLIRSARVQKNGTPEVIGRWTRPTVDLEIAYDIEDDLFEPYAYLHGLLIRHGGGARRDYIPVCARLPEDERALWSRFLDRIEELVKHESFCVYVYGSHERTTVRRLATRYGGNEAIERFVGRFVDMHEIVRNTIVLPTESMSLKAVASWLGFKWRDPDPSGAETIAWWTEYARDPSNQESSLRRILAYNEDDLRATMAVVDWLGVSVAPD